MLKKLSLAALILITSCTSAFAYELHIINETSCKILVNSSGSPFTIPLTRPNPL